MINYNFIPEMSMKCEIRKCSACSKHIAIMETTAEFSINLTANICLMLAI